ncbi:hypothetical protein [Sphingomonas sp. TREG-RG-20F-R18-01]|uniref:hypothetical protein n=1 Tax=Sphingomonas sp. TREG-RG-20F-R18-01 TaxID=2914982 RepID=UPI001F57C75F|nr:hypothetical protein [Sphingomonas sp. TREG-RG-20F-R18-01]
MTKIIPVALILIGILMWRYPARASFNRRNQYGVEIFKSYGNMRTRRLFEGLIRFAGAILLLVGVGQFFVPKQYSLSNLPRPGNPSPKAAEPTQHHRH